MQTIRLWTQATSFQHLKKSGLSLVRVHCFMRAISLWSFFVSIDMSLVRTERNGGDTSAYQLLTRYYCSINHNYHV